MLEMLLFFTVCSLAIIGDVSGQFSRSCRNLLKNDCLQLYPDFVLEFDNLCECDLHPVKSSANGQLLLQQLTSTSSSSAAAAAAAAAVVITSPGIQCMRFSRVKVDRLFECLAQPHSVRSLDFYKDSWQSLPDFGNLTNLHVLRLRDLALPDLDARALFGLNRLKLLELSNNKFKSLPLGLLDGVAGLEELILHGNRLAKLERSQFAAAATKLKRLTLSEMEFQAIPNNFFDIFPDLEFLAIKRTFLGHVGSLGTLRHLRSLHLDQNRIRSIDPNAFMGLYNLRTLDLRRNWLRSFAGEWLLNQAQLENLWLADNIFTCDCRLATLTQWLRQRASKSRQLSLDPGNNDVCFVSSTNRHRKLACGPRCDHAIPAEFFVDVNESDLICTTTTTSTSTTTTKKPPSSTRLLASASNLWSLGIFDDQPILLSASSSGSSTPFPLFSFDKFSLVLWLIIVAACSLVVVIVVTLVVRFRSQHLQQQQQQRRHHYRPAAVKVVAAIAPPLPSRQSPDSSSSSTTSTSTGPLNSSKSDNTETTTGCWSRPGTNRAAKLKAKIAAVSRESSGLSVAERAANKSGATGSCPGADWSPLFERAPSCPQQNSNSGMLLAVDTTTASKRRPISAAFGIEPLLPAGVVMTQQHATPVQATMTLNRSSLLGGGAVLYPAYRTLTTTSTLTTATSQSRRPPLNVSSSTSTSASSTTSPAHQQPLVAPTAKSESLV